MKCSQALEAMLDAEPPDLSPQGSSALALHLHSCARCSRVAATMRADVRALAAVMPPVPVRTGLPWVRWPGVALATAAAVLLFVVMRERPAPTVPPRPADATALVVEQPTEAVPVPAATATARATPTVRNVASALYAMPDPASLEVPADLDARGSTVPPSAPTFDGVSVSSHGKVTVLQTANPKITVIWFN